MLTRFNVSGHLQTPKYEEPGTIRRVGEEELDVYAGCRFRMNACKYGQ
jgi:hypothetical protein